MKRINSLLLVLVLFLSLFLIGCNESKSESIALNSDEVKISVGDNYQLSLNVKNENVTWSSSDEKVASVSEGKVIGVSKGNALITAMNDEGKKAVCQVTVIGAAVESVKLNKHNIEIKKNESEEISARVTPEDASGDLVWESSNEKVVKVDSRGTVSGIKKGKAIVVCTSSNGKSDSCTVVVRANKKRKKSSSSNSSYKEYDNKLLKDTPLYCRASDYATLRASASRSAEEIDIVLSGESVVYLSSTTEFYHVIYQGKKGYVLKDYFTTDPDAPLNYGDR